MENKKLLIGIGLSILVIGAVVLIIKHNEEPKGEGDVSAKSKTGNKFVFTRNK
jgi:hypothetical protein